MCYRQRDGIGRKSENTTRLVMSVGKQSVDLRVGLHVWTCLCVCVCVRACVHACVQYGHVRVRAGVCVWTGMHVDGCTVCVHDTLGLQPNWQTVIMSKR